MSLYFSLSARSYCFPFFSFQISFFEMGISQLWLQEQRPSGALCHDEEASPVSWFHPSGGTARLWQFVSSKAACDKDQLCFPCESSISS